MMDYLCHQFTSQFSNLLLKPHLANNRVLLPQSHNDDAVSLTDAPLCPRGQCVVCLVKNYAMDVFLLAQPAGQTVLMDTEEERSPLMTEGIAQLAADSRSIFLLCQKSILELNLMSEAESENLQRKKKIGPNSCRTQQKISC